MVEVTLIVVQYSLSVCASLRTQNFFVVAYQLTDPANYTLRKMGTSGTPFPTSVTLVYESMFLMNDPHTLTVMAGVDSSPYFLVGELLSIIRHSPSFDPQFRTTNCANLKFRHIACTDASTCIAADDDTSLTSVWVLQDFVNGTDLDDGYRVVIHTGTRDSYIGLTPISRAGTLITLCTRTKCHMSGLDGRYVNYTQDFNIVTGQLARTTSDNISQITGYLSTTTCLKFFDYNRENNALMLDVTRTCTPNDIMDFMMFEEGKFLVISAVNGLYLYEKKPCHTSCATCIGTNPNECLTCVDASTPLLGTCGSGCNEGFVFAAGACMPCGTNCKTCQVGDRNKCTTCFAGSYFDPYAYTCTDCSASGRVAVNDQCLTCAVPCLTCQASISGCTSCVETFYSSPVSPYCLPCDSSCSTCLSNSVCATCPQFLYVQEITGKCDYCIGSKFLDGEVCRACSPNCLTCSGTPTECTSCHDAYYLSGSTCEVCAISCQTCTSLTYCVTCLMSYYLLPDHSCGLCTDPGWMVYSENCIQCDPNCATCAVSTAQCTSCPEGKYLVGSYCETCSTNCLTCSEYAVCTACFPGYIVEGTTCELSSCPTNCGSCLSAGVCDWCQIGFYLEAGICKSCDTSCLVCNSANTCTGCRRPDVILPTGRCGACGFSQYVNGQYCLNCPPLCDVCDVSGCTTCRLGSVWEYGACEPICEEGQFASAGSCIPCDRNCQSCSGSATNCRSCSGNQTLVSSICVNGGACSPYCSNCTSGICTSCENKYFLAAGGICSPCANSCATCSDATLCTGCDTAAGLCKNKTSSLCVPCSSLTGMVNISITKLPAELSPKSAHFAATVSLVQPLAPSNPLKAFLLLAIRPKSRFLRAADMKEETLETKTELASQGTLTMTLVDFLETDKYKLVFRSDVSTFVEFEDTVYEILPYNFTFDFDNPRSSKQQVETAIKQGEFAGGLITAGIPASSRAAADILMTAVSFDPTGLTTKASQMIKIFNRLVYVNVFFGDRLNVFLSGIEKVSGTKRSPTKGSYIKQVGSSGWKARLSDKKVSGDFINDFNWKIALYLLSWLLQVVAWVMAAMVIKVPVWALLVLYWIPKMRLIVLNMVLVDFGFYATHAAMHFNYFPSSQLAMLCLTLIVLDILEMVDIALKMSAWLKFFKTNVEAKKLAYLANRSTISVSKVSPEVKKVPRKLRVKKIPEAKSSALANINNPASSEQASTGNQPNTVKEIDYIRTYACIGYNFHLVATMSASLAPDSSAFNSPARLLLMIHMCRVLAYQILIVSCQSAPAVVILGLTIVEIAKTTFTLKTEIGKRVLSSRLVLLSEVSQSAFLFGFLSVCAWLIFSNQATVSEPIQSMGLYLIIGAVCTEYVLLLANVVMQLLSSIRNYRDTQRIKRENPELLNAQRKDPGMKWFIMYRKCLLEPHDALAGSKTKETSLNTPDDASLNGKRDFRRKKLLSIFQELRTSRANEGVDDDSFSTLNTGALQQHPGHQTNTESIGKSSQKQAVFSRPLRKMISVHRVLKSDQYSTYELSKVKKSVKKESATHIIDRSSGPSTQPELEQAEGQTKRLFKRRHMLL